MLPSRVQINILKPVYIHTGTEQSSKWMEDGESQISFLVLELEVTEKQEEAKLSM